MKSLADLALKTVQLPSLPKLVNDIQELIEKESDINEIADLLATDAALSVQVIELSNTAYYGNKNITRIFDAVHLIGLNKIVLMVRTAYTIEILKSVDGARIDMKKFWIKSYSSALMAQKLSQFIGYPHADNLYTSGLLMYLGELIYALLPPHLQLKKIDRFELAAEQLAIWKFPEFIVESLRCCSAPGKSPDHHALPVAIIHIVDCVMNRDDRQPEEEALQLVEMEEKDVDRIASDIRSLKVGQNGIAVS